MSELPELSTAMIFNLAGNINVLLSIAYRYMNEIDFETCICPEVREMMYEAFALVDQSKRNAISIIQHIRFAEGDEVTDGMKKTIQGCLEEDKSE